MIRAALIGDSGAYGAGPGPGGRHPITPFMTLNAEQSVFTFVEDHSAGGMSFDNLVNGAHSGTWAALVSNPNIDGILISLGGNDNSGSQVTADAFVANINALATMCKLYNKLFAFVGVPDISVVQSFAWVNGGPGDALASTIPFVSADIAHNAELLRSVCYIRGYPFADIRNKVKVDLNNITCDIVHPDQAYSIAIYKSVARQIAGIGD